MCYVLVAADQTDQSRGGAKRRGRFEGQYVEVSEYGGKAPPAAKSARKPARKDHNRGGKSDWMEGFFERPGPELWQAVRTANERN